MISWIASLVSWLPKEFATILIAALPVGEVRAAIPVAVTAFHLHPAMAFFLSWAGNLIPIFFIYAFLPSVLKWAEAHWPWFHRTMQEYFSALRSKHTADIDRYGAAALGIFVAVPLPGTGTWTATIIAVLFGIRSSYGIPSMIIGSAAATLLMLLATEGLLGAFRFFF